jgi:hypothetical protein
MPSQFKLIGIFLAVWVDVTSLSAFAPLPSDPMPSSERLIIAAARADTEAVLNNNIEAVRVILQHPNIQDSVGWSPFYYAEHHGHLEDRTLLLEAGAARFRDAPPQGKISDLITGGMLA